MKLESAFLRSKVARRIFTLFVVCALLPIGALAFLSYSHVAGELQAQAEKRLQQASKGMALSIYERLLLLQADMKTVDWILMAKAGRRDEALPRELTQDLSRKFLWLALEGDGKRAILGNVQRMPRLTAGEQQHIAEGKPLLSSYGEADLQARVTITLPLEPREPQRLLIGEINPAYLWGSAEENNLPPGTEMCILDHRSVALMCTQPMTDAALEQIKRGITRSALGQFDWKQGDNEYLASYRSLPLKFTFLVPHLTLVLSDSREDVFVPVAKFKNTFPFVVLMSLGVVLLLSISQIRRSLGPVEKLQEGTRRIAARDFGSRVVLKSGDEFEELADSFNAMASQLGEQFSALSTIAKIDRAILSTLDTEKVLETVLTRIRDLFPCDRASVTLLDSSNGARETYIQHRDAGSGITAEAIPLDVEGLRALCDHPEGAFLVGEELPKPLAPLFAPEIRSMLVLPFFFRETLSGVITLGYPETPSFGEDDLVLARQLANQVAVAVHNARLYEETKKQAIELERANKMKDDFLAVMSHELRTPLTIIMSSAEIMEKGLLGDISEKQKTTLGKLVRESTGLLTMIESILEASKLEAGAAILQSHVVNLSKTLDELKFFYGSPSDKKVELIWDYPADLPSVALDVPKLRHVLRNLVDNAIKFTDKGSVTVSARYLEQLGVIELKVADTGVGIPQEAIPFIFEKFRQIDGTSRRRFGGAGLGLFIAKKFTLLMQGQIDVESEAGKGSTFTVRIPAHATDA